MENQDLEFQGIVFLSACDQVFTFTDEDGCEWHWNASAGKRLIEQAPRPPCAFYPSEHGLTIEQLRKQYPDLDESYALTTDLSEPILFVPFPGGTCVLIDGWHRLAGAILESVPFLLCYELTEEERDQILVMKFPPGRPAQSTKLLPMTTRPKGGRKP